jgi:hypothetical protein
MVDDDQVREFREGQRIQFALGFIGLVATVVVYAVRAESRPGEMGIAVASCVAVMLMSGVHGIGVIKAGDWEFRAREARRAVEEANATLEQLRSLALVFVRALSPVVALEGMWAVGLTDAAKAETRTEIRDALGRLGIPASTAAAAMTELDSVIRLRYAARLLVAVRRAVGGDNPTRFAEVSGGFEDLSDHGTLSVPPVARFRKFLALHKVQSDEIEQLLLDLEHFDTTGDVRRMAVLENDPQAAPMGGSGS